MDKLIYTRWTNWITSWKVKYRYIYVRISKKYDDLDWIIQQKMNDKMDVRYYYENEKNIYLLIKCYNVYESQIKRTKEALSWS